MAVPKTEFWIAPRLRARESAQIGTDCLPRFTRFDPGPPTVPRSARQSAAALPVQTAESNP